MPGITLCILDPVDVMTADGQRRLVATYGVTSRVRNVRVNGDVTLSRGGRSERLRVVELDARQSVPVLRQYLREVPVPRPYFDVNATSTDEEFAAAAGRRPVFLLLPPA
ncbi:hypothetical protein [Streptomyces sp. Tu 2975]|uniref:hypothetical protein n=1 Tax=Streptomyces sp. Tu 2975 TaxID=2676871 RepID=UPI001ABDDE2C|nr:hypothetical protein [Streptomyces sp. Tu 2975]